MAFEEEEEEVAATMTVEEAVEKSQLPTSREKEVGEDSSQEVGVSMHISSTTHIILRKKCIHLLGWAPPPPKKERIVLHASGRWGGAQIDQKIRFLSDLST